MPSPNGYIQNIVFPLTQRTWTRIELQYDANNPPWNTGQVGSYTIETNIGPVGGPYTLATTTTVYECNPRTNPGSPGGLTSTIYGIGAPAGQPGALTPGMNYEVEIVLRDPGAVEVDRWAVPFSTDPMPTTFSQFASNITTSSADVLLGNSGQTIIVPTGCESDQVIWDWSTTPGGPYSSTPIADVNSLSPSTTLSGLPSNTQIYWRARLFDNTGSLYYTSPEQSFTTLAEEPADFNPQCSTPANPALITDTTAAVSGTADGVPLDHSLRLVLATAPGGPYTVAQSPAQPGTTLPGQTVNHVFGGLAPGTTFYFRTEVRDQVDNVVDASAECTFTTDPATPPPFDPQPCDAGGAGADAVDVEQTLLCDTLSDGTIAGTALAVYEYDATGAPTGAPTFVDPATGDPYVAQGTLMPCPGETGCLAPVAFHRTTTATGPVDHPGRQYDLVLPINPGFAVQSLQVDQVTNAANITWEVDDPDGEKFRQNLTTFIEGRVPAAATVTITNPNAGQTICGTAAPMQIHIECIRLDQSPPDLIELIYNGGQDMVINPAYNETPPLNPPVADGNYGYHLLARQDDPGPFPGNPPAGRANCTNVANRGWETNDVGRTFEIWGHDVAGGVTPTPRGTPVQEVTSDGPPPGGRSTIWQTFQAPASADFIIRIVHGARDPGENHRITLDSGDTGDAQNGTLIDNTTNNVGVVYNGGPWTTFNQTIPLVSGQTYTLALSTNNPAGGARGGLFTDMRAYVDRPNQRATATTDDDTCVVTVDETTTVCQDELWSPICEAGRIESWQNAETSEILTNSAFWGQAPAPVPGSCPATASGEGGGSVAANLVHTYPVCATIGGVRTNLQRVVITDPSGGVLADSFIGPDGGPVETPTTYLIGSCTDTAFMQDQVLCDDNGPFLRKYVQTTDDTDRPQIKSQGDFTLAGAAYTPVGEVGTCGGDVTLGEICYSVPGPTGSARGFLVRDAEGGAHVYNQSGVEVTPFPLIVTCPENSYYEEVLCDQGNGGHQFIRRYLGSPIADVSTSLWDFELDGSTVYVPVGPVALCEPDSADREAICYTLTSTGVELHAGWARHQDSIPNTPVTPNGIAFFDALGNFLDPTADGFTIVPCAEVCDPVTMTGLCLADGTPIGVVARRDCDTGVLTQDGWINLLTGAFTAGPPPAGAMSCSTSQSVQVSGTFCDVDGDGDVQGLVLIEYHYAADGTIESVRLVNATTGATYVPVGTVTTCPAGADQPEQDIVVLCDVNAGVATPFVRDYRRDENGAVIGFTNYTLAGAPYAPTGTVGVCASSVDRADAESEVLCDSTGARFLRTYAYDAAGIVSGFTDRTLAGAAFAPVGAVSTCPVVEALPEQDLVILCDVAANGTTTAFIRDVRRDSTGAVTGVSNYTLAGAAYAPTGTVQLCENRDVETSILCDANGTRFLRSYRYDATSGVVLGFTDTTLAGAAFAPVGAVAVCTTQVATDFDFTEEVLCDVSGAGVSTPFIRRFTFNSTTGAVTTTTNLTLAGAAYNPTGTVGVCSDCCPVQVGSGCTNTGSGTYAAIRNPNGTISLIDAVTGTAITQANIVPCPSDDTVRTLTAQGRLIADADAPWTPGADVVGTLTSVTLTVLSGTANVVDSNATAMNGLPAGYTATWSVDDDNALTGPNSIDAIGGQTAVVWTQR